MERAQADEIAPRATQTDVRANYFDDIGATADLFNFTVAELRHQPPITLSRSATARDNSS